MSGVADIHSEKGSFFADEDHKAAGLQEKPGR
jgi:hypothetical protein